MPVLTTSDGPIEFRYDTAAAPSNATYRGSLGIRTQAGSVGLYINTDATAAGWRQFLTAGGTFVFPTSGTWTLVAATAAALSIGSVANPGMLVFNTAAPSLDARVRLTTTDGVAGGTAKVVGGRSFASTADSTVVTNIAVATLADTTFAIPGSTLKQGSVLKIRVVCRSIGFNVADTHQYTLQIDDGAGPEVLVASPLVAAAGIGANGRVVLEALYVARAAPGPAVEVSGTALAFVNNGAAYTMGPAAGAVATFATTAAMTVEVLVTHSAQNAANQSVVESMYVEII